MIDSKIKVFKSPGRRGRWKLVGKLELPEWRLAARWVWSATMGLGLGVGLGITVFAAPSRVQATLPESPFVTDVVPKQVMVDSLSQSWWLAETASLFPAWWEQTPTLQYWQGSAHLGEPRPVVIVGMATPHQFGNLDLVRPGETLSLLGSNNAWYSYQVIEVRTLAAEAVPGWLSTLDESVVLMTQHPLTKPEWLAVRAQPSL